MRTAAAICLALFATPALADPCEATLPQPGQAFSGPITYVGDGDSLCVATGAGRAGLVEVRLADFYAAELNAPGGREAKATLERIAKGQHATCWAGQRSYDRVIAVCRINGKSIGDMMRRAGVPEGGRGK